MASIKSEADRWHSCNILPLFSIKSYCALNYVLLRNKRINSTIWITSDQKQFNNTIYWLNSLLFLGKAPNGVLPYCHRVRRPASLSSLPLFVTKWGSRISRERFDVESPYFTRTFMPVGSTIAPDITSLSTSGRKLSTFEKGPKKTHPTAST